MIVVIQRKELGARVSWSSCISCCKSPLPLWEPSQGSLSSFHRCLCGLQMGDSSWMCTWSHWALSLQSTLRQVLGGRKSVYLERRKNLEAVTDTPEETWFRGGLSWMINIYLDLGCSETVKGAASTPWAWHILSTSHCPLVTGVSSYCAGRSHLGWGLLPS